MRLSMLFNSDFIIATNLDLEITFLQDPWSRLLIVSNNCRVQWQLLWEDQGCMSNRHYLIFELNIQEG
jgi:PIN domain nuclease of toxin-antitoxin system